MPLPAVPALILVLIAVLVIVLILIVVLVLISILVLVIHLFFLQQWVFAAEPPPYFNRFSRIYPWP